MYCFFLLCIHINERNYTLNFTLHWYLVRNTGLEIYAGCQVLWLVQKQ